MEPTIMLQAILGLWDDWPRWIGPAWPEVSARLASMLPQMHSATRSGQQAAVMSALLLLFRQYPEARRRLQEALQTATQERHRMSARGRGEEEQRLHAGEAEEERWADLVQTLSQRLQASMVIRYTDIACPRRVWIRTPRVSVVVRLTMRPSPYSAALEHLAVREGVPVQVHIEAPGFDVLNAPEQETPILPDQDSLPLVFDLRPLALGDTRITLDFYQDAQPLGTVSVPVECTAEVQAEEAATTLPYALSLERDAEPPDLVLHIAWQETPRALIFKLWEAGRWRRFAPRRLQGDTATDAAGLYRHLMALVVREDRAARGQVAHTLSPTDVDGRVKALGQYLWREILPSELREHYAAQRPHWRDRSMLVISDEPYLPWELVWPYQPGGWEDDMPWCGTLHLTRWLRRDAQSKGTPAPLTRLRLHRLAVVAPTDADLPSAQEEYRWLQQLAVDRDLQDVSPRRASRDGILELLVSGQYDWLHLAAHGKFRAATPEFDTVIWLQQGVSFTPIDITGPQIEGHLAQQRPAFVWNVCGGGRVGMRLTGLAGWATRLVSAGAGLFMGPLWDITDDNGLTFVTAFYEALFQQKTIGAAVQAARLAARQAGDPTWLAYSVYAHPNARITVGPGSPTA